MLIQSGCSHANLKLLFALCGVTYCLLDHYPASLIHMQDALHRNYFGGNTLNLFSVNVRQPPPLLAEQHMMLVHLDRGQVDLKHLFALCGVT
eukprot:scaffold106559_cov29-Prasinocladus_malaysianus.AAC.1